MEAPETLPDTDATHNAEAVQAVKNEKKSSESVRMVAQEIKTLEIKTAQEELIVKSEITKVFDVAEGDAKKIFDEVESYETVKIATRDAKTFGNFWLKFLNDWVFNFASGLAYHLLTAMFPIVIALLILLGFVSGGLSQHAQQALITHLNAFFPTILANQGVLAPALEIIRKDAGFLSFLAVVTALLSGSRLFVTLEDFFDVIYHTQARSFLRQNLMAISLFLLFLILIPFMLLASTWSQGISGFFIGLLASWLLFEAIYMFVPNQRISLRNSWLGALVAALALQIYVILFPLYAGHFLGSYTGNAGFAVILLIFFYYFAIILLLGAEVNAFYSEDIRGTPANIAGLVHRATLDVDKAKQVELTREKARHAEFTRERAERRAMKR